jgi:hypothetical protein
MGFDIALVWEDASCDPMGRNRRVADALLATIPGMTEFPLDAALIAEGLDVPISEVWSHWNQIELNASDVMLGACVGLWFDRAYVTLPSNPPVDCRAALAMVGPLLEALAAHGLRPVDPDGILREYEAQQSRVLKVAEIIGGQA